MPLSIFGVSRILFPLKTYTFFAISVKCDFQEATVEVFIEAVKRNIEFRWQVPWTEGVG